MKPQPDGPGSVHPEDALRRDLDLGSCVPGLTAAAAGSRRHVVQPVPEDAHNVLAHVVVADKDASMAAQRDEVERDAELREELAVVEVQVLRRDLVVAVEARGWAALHRDRPDHAKASSAVLLGHDRAERPVELTDVVEVCGGLLVLVAVGGMAGTEKTAGQIRR